MPHYMVTRFDVCIDEDGNLSAEHDEGMSFLRWQYENGIGLSSGKQKSFTHPYLRCPHIQSY